MEELIGRKKEAKELKQVYLSRKAEFVAIYGRRRVGKTFLVDEVLKGKITFRHAGLSPVDEQGKSNNLKQQLQHFYQSLLLQGVPRSHCPKNWLEAFFMLEMHLQQTSNGRRQVVFLDEYPAQRICDGIGKLLERLGLPPPKHDVGSLWQCKFVDAQQSCE